MSGRFSSMREAFGRTLSELGEVERSLVVVTPDVGDSTRASYFRDRYPERYFNVGISEQHMVGFAAGLAAVGFKPVVAAFAMFLMRGWEQIRNTVCRMDLGVKFVGTHSGFSDSADGSSHQALEDVALMRSLPNMRIVVPADADEVERSLPVVVGEGGPIYYRIGRDYSPPITKGMEYSFKIGRATVLREGEDLAIVGAGPILWDALEAAKDLERLGIRACVINMSTIKPLDAELLETVARRTGAVVTVEEHTTRGGLGSAVAEALSTRYPVPVRMIGVNGFGRTARSPRQLIERYGIGREAIARTSLELLNFRGRSIYNREPRPSGR